MPRLTIVLGAALIFTSLFANGFSLVIPEDDAMASSQVDEDVQSSPEPTTPVDDAMASSQVDEVVQSSPQPTTPVDDAMASSQVDEVAQSSPEPSTPVDDAMASSQVDEVVQVSPKPTTPVDDAMASSQVDEVVQSSPQPTTPVDDAMASGQVDEVAQSSPKPTTPIAAESTVTLNFPTNLVTSTESSQTPAPKENAQTLKIARMIKSVEDRSAQIFRELIDLGAQDVKAKKDLMAPYAKKIGTHVQTVKTYVDGIILPRVKENFRTYECEKYFDDYAISLVAKTIGKMQEEFSEAHRNMSINFGKFSIDTKKTINTLIDLKNMAVTRTDEAENSAEKALAIYESYEANATNFQEDFMVMADGSRIIEKMRPVIDRNINLALDIIGQTFSCVFGEL